MTLEINFFPRVPHDVEKLERDTYHRASFLHRLLPS